MTWQLPCLQSFASSSRLAKKVQKEEEPPDAEELDPYDFSELEGGIEKAQSKLRDDLSKLRAGGRFNPEVLESLRVQVVKDSKGTERLADLAQVVPRGRTLNLIVGEKEVRMTT